MRISQSISIQDAIKSSYKALIAFRVKVEILFSPLVKGDFLFPEAAEEVDFIFRVDGVADNRDVADLIEAGAVGATADVLDGAID